MQQRNFQTLDQLCTGLLIRLQHWQQALSPRLCMAQQAELPSHCQLQDLLHHQDQQVMLHTKMSMLGLQQSPGPPVMLHSEA